MRFPATLNSQATTVDIPVIIIFGMMQGVADNPFFFVLGACIVTITACVVARFCSFTINIGWVILGVLGLVALALLAFAPAFPLSVALLVFAYRIGMTKLVPWLREVRQPRRASPVDDEWVSPVVNEWVSPVRRPQPQSQPRQAPPCDRELVVYEGGAQASSPRAGQIDPWAIWAVVGFMALLFVGGVIATSSPPAGAAAPAWRSAPVVMHGHHHRHRQ
jgi:hypothetical protein